MRARTRSFGAFETIVAVLGAIVFAMPGAASGQDLAIPVGSIGPDAAVQDLEGNPVQLLSRLEPGKPTIIEFWATWCGECAALKPQFDRIHAENGDDITVIMVAVAVGQTLRRVNDWVGDNAPGYAFVWDDNGAAVRAYQAPTTATVIILDRDRRVVYTGADREQDLIAAVQRVLGED
jgi:thiol-disulfide isomerase/thioredoxin